MLAACLLGDHDNIFFLRKNCSTRGVCPRSLQWIHENADVFKTYPEDILSTVFSGVSPEDEVDFFGRDIEDFEAMLKYQQKLDELDYEIKEVHEENGYGFGLKVGLKSSDGDAKTAVIESSLHKPHGMLKHGAGHKTVYLPGIAGEGQVDDGISLFHRNENGETCFTAKEAERASDFIASYGLEERVKAYLQKKRFVLPQKSEKVAEKFYIYGTINILWVCGVVRMDATIIDSENDGKISRVKFDAWPSAEQSSNINRIRDQFTKNNEQDKFIYWNYEW
jgi:hypothetical protein